LQQVASGTIIAIYYKIVICCSK